jgi:hypothetical protein
MTPEARIAAGARRWLKIAVQEMAMVANALEKDLCNVEGRCAVRRKAHYLSSPTGQTLRLSWTRHDGAGTFTI